ncbi:hypothetical protein EJ07DRAFT_152954 [Lizonia empirigonia]|nr:hypothetical protein EJ07DRAFT_152954 [Lizonia empirigonia]
MASIMLLLLISSYQTPASPNEHYPAVPPTEPSFYFERYRDYITNYIANVAKNLAAYRSVPVVRDKMEIPCPSMRSGSGVQCEEVIRCWRPPPTSMRIRTFLDASARRHSCAG